MRRTKIVATLGPATDSPDLIDQLLAAGLNVARLNCSHGTQQEHAARIEMVRAAARQADRAVAILLDLQGPKIRTGPLADGHPVTLVAGQPFTITTHAVPGSAQSVSTTYDLLPIDARVGETILLSDGLIALRVVHTTSTEVECEVVHGGQLREHQGINLPGVGISAPSVTRKDVDDLMFGLEQGVDFVAISFARTASDVQRVKDLVAQAGKETPVIAKIERPEAVSSLHDILRVADGVMVARGDLGVEMPTEQVPILQKQIIEAANGVGIPVITATQMLESMIQNPRPTRAEASDVANAIIDGTDAVMLSGETAKGDYPVEAVQMMALIAQTTEASNHSSEHGNIRPMALPGVPPTPLAISAAVGALVNHLPLTAIVVFTRSGTTARLVAQQRPGVPILAFTESEAVYRRLALVWGVTPLLVAFAPSLERFGQQVQTTLVKHGYAQAGDLVAMTGGHPIARQGITNLLKVITIE